MTTITKDAKRILLVNSRKEANDWIGQHANRLAEVAYSWKVSGGEFETVSVTVLIEPENAERAPAMLPDMRRSTPDLERSFGRFDCWTLSNVKAKRTFSIHFIIERNPTT